MKKIIQKIVLVMALTFGSFIAANAQELGVRFGDVSGGNVAIDGIFSTGDFSRLHGDISFGDGVGVDLLWDFIYRPLGDEAFNWYMGAGAYMWLNDPFWFGAIGELGLEYQFNTIPVSLSIDWRPGLRIVDTIKHDFSGFGLNIRYVF